MRRPKSTSMRTSKPSRKPTGLRALQLVLPPTATAKQIAELKKIFRSEVVATTGVSPGVISENKIEAPVRRRRRPKR